MKFICVLVLALLVSACGTKDSGVTPSAQRVALATARVGAALPLIRVTGTFAPKDQIPLSFKTGGVIARFFADEGSKIAAGQVLAVLQRVEVDAGVRQANELAAKSERELVRAESLYADKVISREQVEDARTQAEVSRAALAAARFNAGYAAIRAPGAGIVLHRLAEAGQLVQAGAPVLEIADESRGWIARAALSDKDIVTIRLGDAVSAQLDAYPGQRFHGKVTQITRAANARTGTFDLEASIDASGMNNPASGLLTKLEITPGSPVTSLVHVPIECLIEGDQMKAWVFVFDKESKRVRRRAVEVAFIDAGGDVALRSGVVAGEKLVTSGVAYLRDGDLVEIQTP